MLTTIYFKRASATADRWLVGDPIIDEINIFISLSNNPEKIPVGVVVLDCPINKGAPGENAILLYNSRRPLGICELPYDAKTLNRYPSTVIKNEI